jgi:ubiquinone/menaquinone biosynthesis C-methylase UbiE
MTLDNPYNTLAFIYDKWIKGDYSYKKVEEFYIDFIVNNNFDNIVELGIGTGRISLKLAKEFNKNIIGIDSSDKMLDILNKKIVKYKLTNKFIIKNQDMLNFKLDFLPNIIILPFRTIGHFNINDRLKLFKNVYNNLQENGTFIFDHYILDKNWAEKNNNRLIKMYENDEIKIFDKYQFNFENSFLIAQVFKQQNNNLQKISSFKFYWFDPNEIKYIIQKVGFKIEVIYGDFDKNILSTNSSEQIWILKK